MTKDMESSKYRVDMTSFHQISCRYDFIPSKSTRRKYKNINKKYKISKTENYTGKIIGQIYNFPISH